MPGYADHETRISPSRENVVRTSADHVAWFGLAEAGADGVDEHYCVLRYPQGRGSPKTYVDEQGRFCWFASAGTVHPRVDETRRARARAVAVRRKAAGSVAVRTRGLGSGRAGSARRASEPKCLMMLYCANARVPVGTAIVQRLHQRRRMRFGLRDHPRVAAHDGKTYNYERKINWY